MIYHKQKQDNTKPLNFELMYIFLGSNVGLTGLQDLIIG